MGFNSLQGAQILTTTTAGPTDTFRNFSIDIEKQLMNSFSHNFKAEVFALKPWEFYLYIGFGVSSPIVIFFVCVCCCCFRDYIWNILSCLPCCKKAEEKITLTGSFIYLP